MSDIEYPHVMSRKKYEMLRVQPMLEALNRGDWSVQASIERYANLLGKQLLVSNDRAKRAIVTLKA